MKKIVTSGNRGMELEQLINYANQQYMAKGIAVVGKLPTPVKIVKTKGTRITSAFLEAKSTVDYSGVYRGRAIYFDAKMTKEKTRFPLDNIHEHQIEHLRACARQGAVTFLIVEFTQLRMTYYMPGKLIIDTWDKGVKGGRKSVPYEDIERLCFQLTSGRGVVLDYLGVVDKLLEQQTA
jgi:recombination protein U